MESDAPDPNPLATVSIPAPPSEEDDNATEACVDDVADRTERSMNAILVRKGTKGKRRRTTSPKSRIPSAKSVSNLQEGIPASAELTEEANALDSTPAAKEPAEGTNADDLGAEELERGTTMEQHGRAEPTEGESSAKSMLSVLMTSKRTKRAPKKEPVKGTGKRGRPRKVPKEAPDGAAVPAAVDGTTPVDSGTTDELEKTAKGATVVPKKPRKKRRSKDATTATSPTVADGSPSGTTSGLPVTASNTAPTVTASNANPSVDRIALSASITSASEDHDQPADDAATASGINSTLAPGTNGVPVSGLETSTDVGRASPTTEQFIGALHGDATMVLSDRLVFYYALNHA